MSTHLKAGLGVAILYAQLRGGFSRCSQVQLQTLGKAAILSNHIVSTHA